MGLRVQPGDLIDGKYRIENIIGEGGMGVVLAARHELLQERYAIKVLSEAPDPVLRERFMREARAAASLRSAHVMRIFDVGEHEGSPYMVMELLAGRDLDALVAAEGPRAVPEAVSFVLQACDAIAEAHAHGMIHRDIKPANLFLAEADGGAVIKLLDFGISKIRGRTDPGLTNTGDVLGSPLFMAPEQLASSRDVDSRADIWSLGATLYELLSGEVPFDGQTIGEIFRAVVRDPPRPLTTVPPELARVVMRCLEKDPERRYQNIGELVSALGAFAPTPVLSVPEALASAPTVVALVPTLAATASATLASAPVVSRPVPRQRSGFGLAWWGAAAAVFLVAVATGGYLWARAQPSAAQPSDDEPPVTEKSRARKKKDAPVEAPSFRSDDPRLIPSVRAAAEARIRAAEKHFAKRDYPATIAEAQVAMGIINGAGFVRVTNVSLLASRALHLKGDAHAELARVELPGNLNTPHFMHAVNAYADALGWEPGGFTCTVLKSMGMNIMIAEVYERDASYGRSAEATYDSTITALESYMRDVSVSRECRARMQAMRDEAVQRRKALPP